MHHVPSLDMEMGVSVDSRGLAAFSIFKGQTPIVVCVCCWDEAGACEAWEGVEEAKALLKTGDGVLQPAAVLWLVAALMPALAACDPQESRHVGRLRAVHGLGLDRKTHHL